MPVWWRAEALKKVTQGCMLNPNGHVCSNQLDLNASAPPVPALWQIYTGKWGGVRRRVTKVWKKHIPLIYWEVGSIKHMESCEIAGQAIRNEHKLRRNGKKRRKDRWCKGIRQVSCSDFQDMYFSGNENVLFVVNLQIPESRISSQGFILLAKN